MNHSIAINCLFKYIHSITELLPKEALGAVLFF